MHAIGRRAWCTVGICIAVAACGTALPVDNDSRSRERLLSGDPVAGKSEYVRCIACHSPQRHRTGPRHCRLIGRPAGTSAGYSYSKAMRDSGIIWDTAALDRFLAAPLEVIPGTTMGFAGVKDARVRADLVAYLATLNETAEVCR